MTKTTQTSAFAKLKYFLFGLVTAYVMFLFYQGYKFIESLPSPANLGKMNFPISTHIYDRNDKLLYEIYRENRTPIKLTDLPKHVIDATISIEDKDFYSHMGVSLLSGVLRAVRDTYTTGKIQGGSTITQQLVKTALLTPERTIERKIKEMVLAVWAERIYTKDQILEMYFNQVSYGGSSYGIEEAARNYFGKHAKDLTLEEGALLAGLPQAPSLYSPFVDPKEALRRRNDVLREMYEQKKITKDQLDKAIKTQINVIRPDGKLEAPHFVFYTKNNLEKQYGRREIEEGGLRVKTTLDLSIQQKIEQIVKEELKKIENLNVTNAAVLVTRPDTGEILSMVGSVDYYKDKYGAFNVVTGLRQPGSSIKPLMYATALERNYTAATLINDSPTVFKLDNGQTYRPLNYDNNFHGWVTLRLSLANSYNVTAVKVLNDLGVNEFIDSAEKMGITTWKDRGRYGLSLTLGSGEVTMIDMATAYGVFANKGKRTDLTYYSAIYSDNNKLISQHVPHSEQVLSEETAFIISDILADNESRKLAFGPNSSLYLPGYRASVKTGTTDDKKDNWTIGYTPEFVVVVWVGNSDGSPMHPSLTSGVTGAAPIWNRVMTMLLKEYGKKPQPWFKKTSKIVGKPCYFGRIEYFLSGTENSTNCRGYLFHLPSIKPAPTNNPN